MQSNIREKYLRFSIHEQGSLNQVFVGEILLNPWLHGRWAGYMSASTSPIRLEKELFS